MYISFVVMRCDGINSNNGMSDGQTDARNDVGNEEGKSHIAIFANWDNKQ